MALPSNPIQMASEMGRNPVQKGVRRDVRWTAKGKAVVDDAAKTAEFHINSDQDDRDEEVVLPSAVLAAAPGYLLNPIFLWAHSHRGTPDMALGTCLEITGDDTLVKAKFLYDVEIPGMASEVYARVAKGTIRAVSIGFIPKRWVTRSSLQADIDALPQHVAAALVTGKIWVVHTEIELIEISQCFIGSNRQALAVGLAFGDDLVTRLAEFVVAQLGRDTKSVAEEPTEDVPLVDRKSVEEAVPSASSDVEPAPDEKTVEVVSLDEFRALQKELAEQRETLKMLLSGAIASSL